MVETLSIKEVKNRKTSTFNCKNNLTLLISIIAGLFFFSSPALQADDLETYEIRLLLAEGKEKVELYEKLSEMYKDISLEKTLNYALNARTLSHELNLIDDEIKSLTLLAQAYEIMGNSEMSIKTFDEAIKLGEENNKLPAVVDALCLRAGYLIGYFDPSNAFESLIKAYTIAHNHNDKRSMAKSQIEMGRFYRQWNEYDKAYDEINKAIEIYYELEDSTALVSSYNLLGQLLIGKKDFKKVLEYFQKALELANKIKDYSGLTSIYRSYGEYYCEILDYPRAIESFKQSLALSIQLGNKRQESDILTKIGHTYSMIGKLDEELNYGLRALDIRQKAGIKYLVASSMVNVGYSYFMLHKYDSAIVYTTNALKIAQEVGHLFFQRNAYKVFISIYEAIGDYPKALEAYRNYDKIKDTMSMLEKDRQLIGMRNHYESIVTDRKIRDLKISNQYTIIISISCVSLLILLFMLFIWRKYRSKKKDNQILENQKVELAEAKSKLEFNEMALRELNNSLDSTVKERTAELRKEIENHEKTFSLLRQNEMKYRTLFNTVADSIFLVDSSTGRISEVNEDACILYRYSASELSSMSITDLEAYPAGVNNMANPMIRDSIKYHKKSDGCVFPVEISTNHFEFAGRQYSTICVRDISERHTYEEKLLNMYGQLKTANQQISKALEKEQILNNMKTNFVRMVSHEYRTPLTIILSSAEILEYSAKDLTSEQISQQIKKIKSSISRMTNMVDDVLVFDKINNEEPKTPNDNVELVAFTKLIIEDIESIDEKKHKIIFESNAEEIPFLTDERLLYHIISNLIVNATKYSPTDTEININLYRNNRSVKFAIKDQGIGISKEEIDKIFDPFHRGRNVFNTQGTGFGLTIVKKATESLNGEIKVETIENFGSTFYVILPDLNI